EILAAAGKPDEADALLAAAVREQPKQVRFRLARAALAADRKRYDEALSILSDAERDLGDGVDLRLSRAAVLAARRPANRSAELEKLGAGAEKFPPPERSRLLAGLSALADAPLAKRFAAQLAESEPGNVEARFHLLRLALAEGNADDARKWLDGLRQAEGGD